MCSSRRRSCPVLVSVENWAQLRNSKNIPTSTSRFRQQPPYCSLVSKQTREETHRLRSNHRRRRRKLISKSIVSSFEWLLMETLSWIAANTARFSKSRERWTSYRKLRRCKRSSIVNTVPQKGFAGVSMKDSFLFNCIEGCNNNNSTKVSERKNGNETERKLTSDTSHVEVDRDHRVVNAKTMLKNPKFKKRDTKQSGSKIRKQNSHFVTSKFLFGCFCILLNLCLFNELLSVSFGELSADSQATHTYLPLFPAVDASLIIGDSAIEIQEVGDSSNQGLQSNNNNPQQHEQQQQQGTNHESSSQYEQPSIVLGSTSGSIGSIDSQLKQAADSVLQPQKNSENQASARQQQRTNSVPAGPLPPLAGSNEATTGKGRRPDDITDGDKNSRNSHDYDINELNGEKNALGHLLSTQAPSLQDDSDDKAITGKVVDFELTPAGGHNKAKIKKKKKKKKKKEEEEFKKWGKKKKSMKKKSEMKKKEEMKKKKEEGRLERVTWIGKSKNLEIKLIIATLSLPQFFTGKKKKKKWGLEEHGQKKKGNFKKKK